MTNRLHAKSASQKPRRTSSRLVEKVISAGEDVKGFDVSVLDVSDVFHLSDFFVIISGRSDRHVQGIVNSIEGTLGKEKIKPITIEGFDKAHWVLMDYGDVIVHVFYEKAREMYDLESLWVNARTIDVAAARKSKKSLVAA
jgi:ribosome-associated protein